MGFLIVEAIVMVAVLADLSYHIMPVVGWLPSNSILLIFVPFCLGDFILVLYTFCAELPFIVTNQTRWEVEKADKITYLQNATRKRPFDRGCWANVYEFCGMSYEKKEWQPPQSNGVGELGDGGTLS
jgi:hypothetical protein